MNLGLLKNLSNYYYCGYFYYCYFYYYYYYIIIIIVTRTYEHLNEKAISNMKNTLRKTQ